MEYRKLGKTDLDVSVVGLGTEYLNRRPRKTVVSVVREAIERGVNYFDIVFSFPEYRDNLGAAFEGYRDRVILAGHICTAETNGHYRMSRDVQENEALFDDLLWRLGTDHVDVLFIQMVNSLEGYQEVVRPGGVFELAQRLQRDGKTRLIGMSGHRPAAALEAVNSGLIDVWMFPINLAWDLSPGRREVGEACAARNVGLVAMKPFAGGKLFQQVERGTVTAVQCLHYILSQTGVTAAVPGVKNLKQLEAALRFVKASEKERDFRRILEAFQQDVEGNCVYCSHCLPCPVGIDIASIMRKLDRALSVPGEVNREKRAGFYHPPRLRTAAEGQTKRGARASDCIECGDCMDRCPFNVDVIARMQQAAELLG